MSWSLEKFFLLAGDIPKKFQLTAAELDIVEGCNNFDTQKRLLDQIVIDRDLPVAMRTYQVIFLFINNTME